MEPITYAVDLDRRAQHLVTVRMTVPADVAAGARIVLPVWTPGSYVVRDYVHHLQRIEADVALRPDGRSAWLLPDDVDGPVRVELEVYGNELTVRTNHIDDHHALLIPPATFPAVEGATDREHHVTIDPPDGWRVWSLLPERDGAYVADDYDHLVDSAFEAGDHPEATYEVRGVPHRFVWTGHAGSPDLARIADEAAAVGEAAVDVFGGDLPIEQYTFLCAGWDTGGGGLEHRDGAVLAWPAAAVTERSDVDRLISLIAHEYFHLWNVKRLTPRALTRLDYERPVHTPSLWVAEGWTAYYDELLPLRSGVWKVRTYLDRQGDNIRGVLDRPGRHLQSVRQASHEAWTKFYIRDENAANVGVSYYDHGALLAWCLDLTLRRAQPDAGGLDAVMRLLWERHREDGYEESDVEAAASEVAGRDLADFFTRYVGGRETPPIEELLEVVGLRLVPKTDEPAAPDLGVELSEDDHGVTISAVLRDRPAWHGGLTGGDRLLAIDGHRVRRGELRKLLLAKRPGQTVEVAVFRGPRLLTHDVALGEPRPPGRLEAVEAPSGEQREQFRRWAGHHLPD